MNISLHKIMLPVSFVLLMGTTSLETRNHRVAQLPNGSSVGCGGCHVSSGGGGARNSFESLVGSSFLIGENVNWVADLASVDSDGDAAKFSLHMNITEMSPHTGQYFEIRVVDAATNTVIVREEIASIMDPAFEYVFMHALEAGASYHVDMWTDHNGNGSYDAPPTDHSWRVELIGIADNTSQNFHHSTDFTDIGGPVSIDSEHLNPQDFVLYENYPNPFNPETRINFNLASTGHTSLDCKNWRCLDEVEIH